MCSENDLNNILGKIVETYRKIYKENLDKVYLYGSYSRGDYTEDSDIDIVAIVHGERKELEKLLYDVWDISSDLELDYEVIVSPTVIPFNEFYTYKEHLPYYRNIYREGIDISGRYKEEFNRIQA